MQHASGKRHLLTEPYKGVRDFYPEDQARLKYIFDIWRKTAERFGYIEYSASPLEPTDLYLSKGNEEIIAEQTYTFTDRGGRSVTLRPEMTPTIARMVAARRKELVFPLRWYSIPNMFRYERPQKGRLREHWQLNVDIFGLAHLEADTEIITVAAAIMRAFGAREEDYVIRINNRRVIQSILRDGFVLTPELAHDVMTLIDRKAKMDRDGFRTALHGIMGDRTSELLRVIESDGIEQFLSSVPADLRDSQWMKETLYVIHRLEERGVTNVAFDPTLMRGFDYYTGIVFEIFDTNQENKRSLFGGGRYDDLTALFGGDPIPGVGFGMGDVRIADFLTARRLWPEYVSPIELFICTVEECFVPHAETLADTLREQGLRVAVNLTDRKIPDQIKTAAKQGVKYILCIGKRETETRRYPLKNLVTGEERPVGAEGIATAVRSS